MRMSDRRRPDESDNLQQVKQSPPRGGLAVILAVLQEAVLVLAVNPATERQRAREGKGEKGRKIPTAWH